ncbi:MAG: MBOAT family protein [Flavobacteriales bacterium]|nr:MBOAT family protein [Flavobacteriales bacterium]
MQTFKPAFEIVLPLGISFYTFQSMSYSLDIYLGKSTPTKSLWHFAGFISMFPQLIAGPIVRYNVMDKQLKAISSIKFNYSDFNVGMFYFTVGMFRKLFIADWFARWSDLYFNGTGDTPFFGTWIGILSFTLQIYFDFSAYSEMALGLGRMMGFRLPINFFSPFRASSFGDIWKRWHITLYDFLIDYVFNPMAFNKRAWGIWGIVYASIVTFILSGVWHGAAWTLIMWGFVSGIMLAVELFTLQYKFSKTWFYRVFVIFSFILSLFFFKSRDMEFAFNGIATALMFNGVEPIGATYGLPFFSEIQIPEFIRVYGGVKNIAMLLIVGMVVTLAPNVHQIKIKDKWYFPAFTALVLIACVLRVYIPSPFIYFQF